jgi:hypothetical protein
MKSIFAVIVLLLLSGCATLISESSNTVLVSSAPAQATFKVSDRNGHVVYTGVTPATINLNAGAGYFKRSRYTIEFQKTGYQANNLAVNADYNRWYQMNFWTVLGIVGAVSVDPITGAMWTLPERAFQSLAPAAVKTNAVNKPLVFKPKAMSVAESKK